MVGYSHATKLSAEELLAGHAKDDNQVAGYNPANYAGQVIDETTSHLTKAASCQVIGYSHSTDETPSHPLGCQKTTT